ncbi:stearoyl-CoA desaturase [Kickxella alabastrina]|uniref:stearoyl-CoA desaturase n=1 Tax=Kickxella alabastrina TaxID=61397 RepID=UPI00221FA353|nr:stearoyl-CoA desaturase [Kickxella alabastrina]KAI7827223.1 stearoyl-CoA desaturase [Kickxella alabastrina]
MEVGEPPEKSIQESEKDVLKKPVYKVKAVPKDKDKSIHSRWYWPFASGILIAEAVAIYAVFFVKLKWPVGIFVLLYGVLSGLCITAGYHRLWAHRSYKASWPLAVFLAIFGAASIQGSIIWWVQNHRLHHRYTDTERDPYNIKRGFWYAHHGWILFRRKEDELGYADMTDLHASKVVLWQYKYYFFICAFSSLILPTAFCGLVLGDWKGGFFWGAVARLVGVQQVTFCVNSVAHTFGTQPYSDEQTPRDNWFTGIITLGEGYHNFHHAFPNDYRNGVRWYDMDITKWLLYAMEQLGLASNLKRFPRNEIMKGRVAMKFKNAQKMAKRVDYGTPIEELPMFTASEFVAEVKERSKKWIVIEGFIYNVEEFIKMHPGGPKLIKGGIGKDMTNAFNGGVYNHHYSARNLMNSTMRVGKII